MALKWRKKVLLAKIEATYGTDAAPSGAANAVLAVDVSLTPMEGSDKDRELDQPYLGASGTIPTDLHQKLSFKVELAPSGAAGTAPGWGPLLRACAVAETITASTNVIYNPITDNHESVTIHLNIDGTLYAMVGSRGNARFDISASGIPYIEFEFTGLYVRPVDAAAATPDLSGFKKPNVASHANTPTFTIDATDYILRAFKLDLGNQIIFRFLIGSEDILITDKADAVEMTIEAVSMATLNPYQLAETQTSVAIALAHGKTAGNIATLAIPAAQMQRPQGLQNQDGIKEWPLRLEPLPQSGNDQWTLTLT